MVPCPKLKATITVAVMIAADLLSISQNSGKTNAMVKSEPKKYRGRRPILSLRYPKIGMVMNSTTAA